jgi:hypothetical protein
MPAPTDHAHHGYEEQLLSYLPQEADLLLKEALGCYHADCFNAFASMCRRTAQAVFDDLGESGKLKLFDELNRIRDLVPVETETFGTIKKVIFGNEHDSKPALPVVDRYMATVLLEVLKDLLYQAYVRRGRLQQAILVRRMFVEGHDNKVTPLAKASA